MAALQAAIITLLIIMKVYGKFFKAFAALLVIAALVYSGYLLLRGADLTMPALFTPVPGARLLMSMEGFKFAQSEDGRVSWRMNARSANLYSSKEAQLKDIEIVYITPENKEAALIGDVGIMDTVTGNASVRRDSHEVRVVTGDGYLLTTDSLTWKAGDRLVLTPDPFKLLGSEIYLEGRGLTANVDMRKIVVNNNVKAVLQE
ncbi:MAG TPA: LPS export ABC transporter periplasmic protein LptC [Nitrospirota bacterium]|nr:LPS export ABC transporter periplasmic protein LptC [Nitrospirota bacterium]